MTTDYLICDPSTGDRVAMTTLLLRECPDATVTAVADPLDIPGPDHTPVDVVLLPLSACPKEWSPDNPVSRLLRSHRVVVYGVQGEPLQAAAALAHGAVGALASLPAAEQEVVADDRPRPVRMSPRLQQILVMMSRGLSNPEIGVELGIADSTVKMHCKRLYHLLGAEDRAHAVALGFRTGLLPYE